MLNKKEGAEEENWRENLPDGFDEFGGKKSSGMSQRPLPSSHFKQQLPLASWAGGLQGEVRMTYIFVLGKGFFLLSGSGCFFFFFL